MKTRLSVCLLTRDEERNIGRAVRSVAGVADEVVVADSGSTDRTVDLAREAGALVYPFTWDDDFSAGRNFALSRATGDWVFWLNPDEEFLPASPGEVQSLTQSAEGAFGFLARIRSVPKAERTDQFSERFDLRLYRNRPDLRYVGRLHPTFAPELARAVNAEGMEVRTSELTIRQHAYMSVVTEPKLRWAVRLLERELEDRPGQLHYLIEYGRNLLMLNDPKGHDVMAEAVAQVLPSIDAPNPPGADVPILLEYVLTTPPALNRSPLTPDRAIRLALRWFSDSPPLLWAMAGFAFQNRWYPESVVLLERLVHLGDTNSYDRAHLFDPRVVGPWALQNLGQCYRGVGRPDEARRCFTRLLADPDFAHQGAKLLAELDQQGS